MASKIEIKAMLPSRSIKSEPIRNSLILGRDDNYLSSTIEEVGVILGHKVATDLLSEYPKKKKG